jgi:hypothetical protein
LLLWETLHQTWVQQQQQQQLHQMLALEEHCCALG